MVVEVPSLVTACRRCWAIERINLVTPLARYVLGYTLRSEQTTNMQWTLTNMRESVLCRKNVPSYRAKVHCSCQTRVYLMRESIKQVVDRLRDLTNSRAYF